AGPGPLRSARAGADQHAVQPGQVGDIGSVVAPDHAAGAQLGQVVDQVEDEAVVVVHDQHPGAGRAAGHRSSSPAAVAPPSRAAASRWAPPAPPPPPAAPAAPPRGPAAAPRRSADPMVRCPRRPRRPGHGLTVTSLNGSRGSTYGKSTKNSSATAARNRTVQPAILPGSPPGSLRQIQLYTGSPLEDG